MLVTLAGHDIIMGRSLLLPTTPTDYANFILGCLIHDIGYVRGILQGDDGDQYVADANGRTVRLPRGSSDAGGARVEVHTPRRVFVRTQTPATGFMAQSDSALRFGLAEDARVRKIVVQWPSGHRQELRPDAINQTLSRTIITSGLTFLSVLALVIFGGPVLRGFSLALFIGIIRGTYSSIAIASPIMLWWKHYEAKRATETKAAEAVARSSKSGGGRPGGDKPSAPKPKTEGNKPKATKAKA